MSVSQARQSHAAICLPTTTLNGSGSLSAGVDSMQATSYVAVLQTGTVADGATLVVVVQESNQLASGYTSVATFNLAVASGGNVSNSAIHFGPFTVAKRYARISVTESAEADAAVTGAIVYYGAPTHTARAAQYTEV